jgi:sigma-B regulation protein RsbU (phosphoserine phosphatase)
MGDVSGHGVHSGLLAAAVQGCLNNQVSVDPAAAAVLAAVDRVVRTSGGQMMTLCYTVLDPLNGLAVVASAGHWSPYHYVARTGTVEEAYPSTAIAPALGAFPTDVYPDHQVTLEPEDILIFYSDGILETINSAREMYGEERFQDALRRHTQGTSQQIRDAILDEVKHFRGEMPQDDDIALVVVKYRPSSAENKA